MKQFFVKLKAGVFDGSQIGQLMKDEHIIGTMPKVEKNA